MSDPRGKLIMTITNSGRGDRSPMEMVSKDRLEHLQRCEAELMEIKARDANSGLVGSAGFEPATPTV